MSERSLGMALGQTKRDFLTEFAAPRGLEGRVDHYRNTENR